MSEPTKQPGFFDGNPRMLFAFGLVSGIALVMVLNSFFGVLGTSAVAANGTNDDEDDAGTPTVAAPVAAGKLAVAVSDEDHIRGDIDKAKVVLVEYSDFECPFCSRHHPTMQQIFDKYGDDVAWVYRHFPLSFHPQAEPAANASECAADQGKFWEYADELFANNDELGEDLYKQIAKDLGLNTSKFNDCLANSSFQDEVSADVASGRSSGVSGTPATFVNGTMVVNSSGTSAGAAPLSTFTALIDKELE